MAIRLCEVNSRKIAIVDDAVTLDTIETEFAKLTRSAFTRTEYARPGKEEFRHWIKESLLSECITSPFWPASLEAIQHVFGPIDAKPTRCYTNFASYGDMLFPHTDCPESRQEITALWYICPKWKTDWGGETLFFDQFGDAVFVSSPKPRRLVVFDGRVLHVGSPPSRICEIPRYTLVIKVRS